MRQLLLVTIAFLVKFNISAQTRVLKDERGELITEITYTGQRVAKYRGSAYLKDTVELGTFSLAGGKELQKPVLFDVLNQSFLAYMGDDFVPIKPANLQLGNRHLQYIKGAYHHARYIADAYYETYYEAKVKILVKYGCLIKKYDRNLRENPSAIF